MPALISPNTGLIFDRPPIAIPKGALRDGLNFRVKNGTLESRNLGWELFEPWSLNGPVWLIDNFFPRGADEKLIFGTATDLYAYNPGTGLPEFITPVYTYQAPNGLTWSTGSTTVTANGSVNFVTQGVKPGDWIIFSTVPANYKDPFNTTWRQVVTVSSTTLTLNAVPTSSGTNGDATIRRTFSDVTAGEWSFDTFVNDGTSGQDLWFATNGIEPVVTWNGSDNTVTLHPELGFTCKVLTTYTNMMIYGNVTQSGDLLPTTIINSDIGLPLNAGATGTGLSEQFVVHSNTDEIMNMIPLGDYLIIYSERTIVPAQFVGDPLIFMFRVALSGVGPISGNAIADFGDFHEFLGSDAGYLFDGVTLKEVNTHVWRDILRQADPMRRRQIFGHFDEEQGDLIWSVPGNTDPGVGEIGAPAVIAWTEHYLEEAVDPNFEGSPFSRRNFPFTITGFYQREVGLTWAQVTEQWQNFNFAWNDQFFQAAFPLNLGGDENGQIWILNQIQTGGGDPLPSYVRTGRIALQTGRERDLLTRIYPFARSLPYMLEITLFMGDHLSGEPQNKGTQLFDMNLIEGAHFVTFYRRGRVMEFQFGSSDGNPWVLEGWDYDKVDGGRR